MATTPTSNAVPSESARDLKFNAGKIDEFVTSIEREYIDRFGNAHYTIEGLKYIAQQEIANFGWIVVKSFQDGATLTLPNEVLYDESTGEYYRWDGDLPKTVPAGSTPETTGGIGAGAWLSVGDAVLRGNLISDADGMGDALVTVKQPFTGAVARTQHYKNMEIISVLDFGVVGDGETDDTEAFQAAIDAAHLAGTSLYFPGCSVLVTAELTVYAGTAIYGDGRESSIIKHDHTGSLFTNSSFVEGLQFLNFAVKKTTSSMDSGKYLFDFTGGCQSVVLENLLLGNVDTAGIKLYGVFNTGASTTSNGNLVFRDVLVNQFSGRAYNFGGGDSVWFYGGRIIGTHDQTTDWLTNGAQGIYFNGGMGGFWLYGTDIVLCKYGMIINDSNGSSNKEIFLNSPCFDSCSAIGLSVQDTTSYVSISNIWSAK